MSERAWHPSDLALDQGGTEVDAHLAACAACAARAAEAAASHHEFTAQVFPRTVEAVRMRRPRRPFKIGWPAIGVAAAAMAGFILFTQVRRAAPVVEPPRLELASPGRVRIWTGRPRHVAVYLVDDAGHRRRLWPHAGTAQLVNDHDLVSLPAPDPHTVAVVAVVADKPFNPEHPPSDGDVVTLALVERSPPNR